MASTEYRLPKFKTTLWYKAYYFIDFLGMGNQKWTEKVIDWLSKYNKVACKIGKNKVYFKELM